MASTSKSPRHGRNLSNYDLDRFLRALAATGNATLAAERVGRHRSTFVKRRRSDPAFAARCAAAIAESRLQSSQERGVEPRTGRAAAANALKCARGDLLLVHGRARPAQIRRAGGGELTPAGVAAFLKTLAATANLRLSADRVGVRPNAIRNRRRRDPAFDKAVKEALLIGYRDLEAALIESACRALDPDPEYEEWLDRNGGAALPKMDVDQAFMLFFQHRRTCQLGWDNKRSQVEVSNLEDVRTSLRRSILRLGLEAPKEE